MPADVTDRPDTTQIGSTLEVLDRLRGASYPASRDELVEEARKTGASETAIEALQAMPSQAYASGEEVADALGTAIPPSGAGSGARGDSAEGDDTEEHPAPYSPPEATN
jgi:Protein of unknown function (DUF2795)